MSTRSWNSSRTLLGPLQNFLLSKNNSGRLQLIWIVWIHLMYRGGRQEAAESDRRKTGKDFCVLSGRKYPDVLQQQQGRADCLKFSLNSTLFPSCYPFFFLFNSCCQICIQRLESFDFCQSHIQVSVIAETIRGLMVTSLLSPSKIYLLNFNIHSQESVHSGCWCKVVKESHIQNFSSPPPGGFAAILIVRCAWMLLLTTVREIIVSFKKQLYLFGCGAAVLQHSSGGAWPQFMKAFSLQCNNVRTSVTNTNKPKQQSLAGRTLFRSRFGIQNRKSFLSAILRCMWLKEKKKPTISLQDKGWNLVNLCFWFI